MLKLYYDHTTFHPYHTFKVMLKYRKNKPIKTPWLCIKQNSFETKLKLINFKQEFSYKAMFRETIFIKKFEQVCSRFLILTLFRSSCNPFYSILGWIRDPKWSILLVTCSKMKMLKNLVATLHYRALILVSQTYFD